MCGIAGILSLKNTKIETSLLNLGKLWEDVNDITTHGGMACEDQGDVLPNHYLGGQKLKDLLQTVRKFKRDEFLFQIFSDQHIQSELNRMAEAIEQIIAVEEKNLSRCMAYLSHEQVETGARRIEDLKDILWCLTREIGANIMKIRHLIADSPMPSFRIFQVYKHMNAVFNSIDRLEVRGRDSAGISLMFIVKTSDFTEFKSMLEDAGLSEQLMHRTDHDTLGNGSITLCEDETYPGNNGYTAVTFVYKIAEEVGSLGDNIAFLRQQVIEDELFYRFVQIPFEHHTVISHTRWASVGVISVPNCHPVDNRTIKQNGTAGTDVQSEGIIHVCLNGDIDNFQELNEHLSARGKVVSERITTDTKIIPLQIQHYIDQGNSVASSFRLAVNDFKGSHAIAMHTNLEPGKLFLAQRGSGQAIFVGLAEDHYMAASEIYGLIEETDAYVKLDGETAFEGKNGPARGQIFILSQQSEGGIRGIEAMLYDGTPLDLDNSNIKTTQITSRDIDRQEYPHYFLKEISEAPQSVQRTIQNRWKVVSGERQNYGVYLDEIVVPETLCMDWQNGRIRRIFFIGQGTAGVAAQACADIFNYYMPDSALYVRSLKSSELSGFNLNEPHLSGGMEDTLVIPISQSGTTTDTNRAVDMVRNLGARTIAIVNRRDSDLTFKVDGVMYTSSGRDIEMSVASTKAFYSQIVAGALLGLYLADLKGYRRADYITEEIKQLIALPGHMRSVLGMKEKIRESAEKTATEKMYWAVVGSGPNKTSSDEIRIKLSELCYKTISSDYVEDKKHIDLSAEPLILVCAAGTRDSVIGDIVKDTAIFQSHKAMPIVIANEGEHRFDAFAEDIFHVPVVSEHLAPILNTLVGHIWGYYAALSINKGSQFLHHFRETIRREIETYQEEGMNAFEFILERSFRERIARFYTEFRKRKASGLAMIMGTDAFSDMTLLLKYLSGRLSKTEFEFDFGIKGTAVNILDTLLLCLGNAIRYMSRPVDAIKHQAKTVTVGTSRSMEKVEGVIFDILPELDFNVTRLLPKNALVLKNLQNIVERVKGYSLYRIHGLNFLGEPVETTTIELQLKTGELSSVPSRVESDPQLKGTKRRIVKEGNVYIGKGIKDGRSILVIPILSDAGDMTSKVEYLILLNIEFKEQISLPNKIRALGKEVSGKYERIKELVQERSVIWDDQYLESVPVDELFGRSAEKIADMIAELVSGEDHSVQ